MLTGYSMPKCRELLAPVSGLGCFLSDIARVLKANGFICKSSKTMTSRCVLRLQVNGGSHFVLRWDGKTYDPARGTSHEIPANVSEVLSIDFIRI